MKQVKISNRSPPYRSYLSAAMRRNHTRLIPINLVNDFSDPCCEGVDYQAYLPTETEIYSESFECRQHALPLFFLSTSFSHTSVVLYSRRSLSALSILLPYRNTPHSLSHVWPSSTGWPWTWALDLGCYFAILCKILHGLKVICVVFPSTWSYRSIS